MINNSVPQHNIIKFWFKLQQNRNASNHLLLKSCYMKLCKKLFPLLMFKQTIRSALAKPATVMYPECKPKLPEKFRGEPIFDHSVCVGCGLCAKDCPTGAIEMVTVNGKHRPQLDLSKCIFCYQCAETCHVGAIKFSCSYELATTDKSKLIIKPQFLNDS